MPAPIRILKAEAPQKYTLGIVAIPDVPDADNEVTSAPAIEAMCRDFNRRLYSPPEAEAIVKALAAADAGDEVELELDASIIAKASMVGIQHALFSDDLGAIVESYIAPCDMAIPQADGTVEQVAKGSWLMGHVWSDPVWSLVQKGELEGLSWGGFAFKVKEK